MTGRLPNLLRAIALGGVVISYFVVRDDYAGFHVAIEWMVATVAFVSDRDAAERFALWLESVAILVRNEAELRDRDERLCASDDAALDRMIWGD